MTFRKQFLEILILLILLFLVSCASDKRPENTSSYSSRTVEKVESGQHENLHREILEADTDSICGKSRDTESCSDLGVLIKNSSSHYKFTTEQTMTHGSVTTPIPSSIAPLADGFSLLDQSGYGADTTISLTNSDGNYLSVDVYQDYCFWKGQDVSAWPSENSKQVTMSCEVQNSDYDTHMGCAVCTIETPNYKAVSMLDFYEGESAKCSWQNDAHVIPEFKTQVCPPYAVYFDKAQRDLLKLYVRDDGFVYKKNDEGNYILFDTFNVTDGGDAYVGSAIFVMGFDGTLYSSLTYGRNMIMHSSFFSGKPVAAAGEIKAQDGVIQYMNNCSGHYRPTVAETQQAIDSLNEQGYYDVDEINYQACPHMPALPTSGMEPLCNPLSPLCIINGGEGEDIAE